MSNILFAEKYLKLNENISSILVFSNEALIITFPFLIGSMIEMWPQFLLYFEMICWCLATGSFLITLIIIKF